VQWAHYFCHCWKHHRNWLLESCVGHSWILHEFFGTFWKQCPCKCYCIFVNKEITRGQISWIEAWATAMLLVAKNCCTDWAVCTGVLSYLINHPQFWCCSKHFPQTYFLSGCKTFHKNTEQLFGLKENISVEQCLQSQKWSPTHSWCLTWFVLLSVDIGWIFPLRWQLFDVWVITVYPGFVLCIFIAVFLSMKENLWQMYRSFKSVIRISQITLHVYWPTTQGVKAAKRIRLTQKIVPLWHLLTESCTTCHSLS